MEARNLLIITGSNLRLNIKQTIFPAVLLLLMIPWIYGTSNLDSAKSAECLERIVALVGLPVFVPLLRPEQDSGMNAMIAMRPFPYRMIVVLRVVLSLIGAVALIFAFEGYMCMSGCRFPVCTYALRTLVAAMTLGFVGLLASAVSRNTAVGFLVSFCWYCALQIESVGAAFHCVSNGIGVQQALVLMGSGVAIILFSKPA
ncbi:hypothetical protein [Acutalibacter caecimuris]|uniref:hypothetical protein n=1 Tax=Acutalibacter caecimuris TaxID=3093657 RepID=UPI002AC9DAC7|nr:hypothetical protein [Acutalibacter sp. M00118]